MCVCTVEEKKNPNNTTQDVQILTDALKQVGSIKDKDVCAIKVISTDSVEYQNELWCH